MYICFYMVSVTITFEIFKLRYYVYCALFDLSCKLLLSIYLIQERQTRPNSGGVAEGHPRFDKGGVAIFFLLFTR